jgi:gliding motility-associated-like protein
MKRNFISRLAGLSFLLSIFFTTSYGQLTITDTGNCLNHTLFASITGTMPLGTGITADDAFSGVFPLGFTFTYYGVPYTQCIIGSNGMISFNLGSAGAYCPWPISAALLGNASAYNCICGPWCDILISAGGSITYSTAGVAPNRKFAVTWCGSRMYGCTAEWTTSQIILYETSNDIEVHTAHKTSCAWNSGRAITGVQNSTGTLATVPPGRDWTPTWTVISPPEAWRFTTSGPTYTVGSIPYAPMPYASSGIYWYDSTTGAYLGSGPYLTVSPSVPTTYMAAALGCNDTTKAYMHILPPSAGIGGIPHIDTFDIVHPSECGKCDGKIVLRGVNPHQIDTVFVGYNGVAWTPYVDSAALDSTITLSGLCGGVYNYIYVKVGNCPSNQISTTLVTPVLAISNTTFGNPTICGKYDGWIKLFGLTPFKAVSVAYSKGGVPQTPFSSVVAADSTVLIPNLGAGAYTGIAATVGLCTAPGIPVNLVNPPPYMPSFDLNIGLGCSGDTVFMTNTTTPSGFYSYWDWHYPSGKLDSLNTWHIYNTHNAIPRYDSVINLRLIYNTTSRHDPACELYRDTTFHIDHQIHAIFAPDVDTICWKVAQTFNNASTSNYNPTYYWLFGDGFYDDGTENPDHSFALAGTYPVKLTVTDNIGCKDEMTRKVEVISLELFNTYDDTDVCLRNPMRINLRHSALAYQKMPVSFVWTQSPAGGNLNFYDVENPYFSGIGDYTVTVNASTPPFTGTPLGCPASKQLVIRSHPPVTFTGVTANPQFIKLGSSIQLNAQGATYYKWTPDNGTLNNPAINNPIATPTDSETVYVLQGMNLWGCIDTTSITVYTDLDVNEFVPSAFTPNGDGKNDIFRIIRLKYQKLVQFRVFNRWGTAVFETINPEVGWDGTYKGVKQDMGTYVYEIIVGLPNGENKVYKGNVMLIR